MKGKFNSLQININKHLIHQVKREILNHVLQYLLIQETLNLVY